jgi:DNA polymerase-4
MGAQRALGRRRLSAEDLDASVVGLVDRVCHRMRAARRVCRTVIVRMRFDDFTRATRSYTLLEATASTHAIVATARGLLASAAPLIEQKGLTLIGITLTNLMPDGGIQLALPFERPRQAAIDAVVDEVRERFGSAAINRAVLLGRDPGISVPLLPD